MTLQEIEKKIIKSRLKKWKNKSRVAQSLGISLAGLYLKIKQHELNEFMIYEKKNAND